MLLLLLLRFVVGIAVWGLLLPHPAGRGRPTLLLACWLGLLLLLLLGFVVFIALWKLLLPLPAGRGKRMLDGLGCWPAADTVDTGLLVFGCCKLVLLLLLLGFVVGIAIWGLLLPHPAGRGRPTLLLACWLATAAPAKVRGWRRPTAAAAAAEVRGLHRSLETCYPTRPDGACCLGELAYQVPWYGAWANHQVPGHAAWAN